MRVGVGTTMSDIDGKSGESGPDRVLRYLDGNAYVYARTQAALIARCGGYDIPSSEQADIVQTVLYEACQAVARPDFKLRKEFGHFIRTLAHRRCIDWWRRNRPNVPMELDRPSLSPLPDEKILANERLALATEIVNQLPPTCRELIEKHIFAGLPYAEIAATTGRTEGALRVEMCKCLEKARQLARRLLLQPDSRGGGQGDLR